MKADTAAANAAGSNGSWRRGNTLLWIFGLAWLAFGSVGLSAVNAPLIISEFRLRGNGVNDEFIKSTTTRLLHTVATSDGSSGYAGRLSSGGTRFTPNGTVIPRADTISASTASATRFVLSGRCCDGGGQFYTTDFPERGIAVPPRTRRISTLANRPMRSAEHRPTRTGRHWL